MRLALHLLGPPEVHLNDEPVTGFVSDKARALLFYLAVEGNRAHRRETLAGLFWSDYPERSARTNLSNALSNLRTVLADQGATHPLFLVTRETIHFDAQSDHWLDVAAFEALAKDRHWEEATALYRGGFLEGFSLSDSVLFEEWALVTRERLRRQMLTALEEWTAACEETGDYAGARDAACRQLELEPWHEGAHRALMRCLALSGERASALAQYQACARALKDELGVLPSQETTRLYEQIREGGLGTEEVGPRFQVELDRPRHNLPAQLIPFVGREEMLAEIEERLCDPGCRLLTLLGPGGSGKTRLALEVAARLVERFAHGAWFVSLAPLQSVEAIVPTIAHALGCSFYVGGEPKEHLLNYLCGKGLLLVLDNYEHLAEGVGLVSEILHAAPEVVVLATSRATLNVQGESLYPVSGMSYPALADVPQFIGRRSLPSIRTGRGTGGEDALQYSAVRLFVESARRAQPGFELSADNVADVVRICHLVAGMPLAILLAAAWLRVLAPVEIADQIAGDIHLDFLASGQRDLPERQRSMRAVFDHSWKLLPEGQQAVLEALSVFRGSCTREAAQEVAGVSLRDLLSLVDRSLLQRTAALSAHRTGNRFEMHELLRQYAAEKLERVPSAYQAARERHCAYYIAALTRWAADLKGAWQQAVMAEMEADFENVCAAWEWDVESARERVPDRTQVKGLSEAMEALGHFYRNRARYTEGESTFRLAAKRLSGQPVEALNASACLPYLRAQALTWQSLFCYELGHNELARDLLRQSLDLLDATASVDTRKERAHALLVMGDIEKSSGNLDESWQLCTQSLALHRALGHRWEIAMTLHTLAGVAAFLGEYDEAKKQYQEALAIRRELGDPFGLVSSLVQLGSVFGSLGQLDERERLTREGLAVAREIGDRVLISMGLCHLAWTLMHKGELAEACLLAEECLEISDDLGAGLYWTYFSSQNILGMAMAHLGQYKKARVHLQQSLALARKADTLWAIGHSFLGLGLVALAEGNHACARQLLQEGSATEQVGQRSDTGWHLAAQAGAALGLGRQSEAKGYLYDALQIARAMRDALTLQFALPVAALLLAESGDPERAVEVYARACCFGIVAHSRLWEDIAGRQIAALSAALPPEVVAAAQERGRTRGLWATVEELLAMF